MSEQLKSPDRKSLKRLIAKLDEIVDAGYDVTLVEIDGEEHHAVGIVPERDITLMRDCLHWTFVYLQNRADYHKGRLVKEKVKMQLLEDELRRKGVDVDALKKEAQNAGDEAIINTDDEA